MELTKGQKIILQLKINQEIQEAAKKDFDNYENLFKNAIKIAIDETIKYCTEREGLSE